MSQDSNEPKWTKGPWGVDENGLAGYGDNGANFKIVDGEGESLAELNLYHRLLDDGETGAYIEAKANANLIAAAPELYEALERLLIPPVFGGPTGSIDKAHARMEADRAFARAALAKARGE